MCHKAHLNRFEMIQVKAGMFSDHKAIKLEKLVRKISLERIWKLNSTLLTNPCQRRSQKKKYFELKKNKTQIKIYDYSHFLFLL